jgi:hypothetical protein
MAASANLPQIDFGLILNLNKDAVSNKNVIITGQPVLAAIHDESTAAQLVPFLTANCAEMRIEREGPNSFIFANLEHFHIAQVLFNSARALRKDRLILQKVQKDPSVPFMVDSPVIENRCSVSLELPMDTDFSKMRAQFEAHKEELLQSLFGVDGLSNLFDSVNEANVLPSSKSPSHFQLHLAVVNADAFAAFDSFDKTLVKKHVVFEFKGTPIRLLGCFAPTVNCVDRDSVRPPPTTRAYQIRFRSAVVLRNIAALNEALTDELGASPEARVVLGHPTYKPLHHCVLAGRPCSARFV